MKRYVIGLLFCSCWSAVAAQTVITFDVNFHTVYEASGAFTPALQPTGPGPFNGGQPVPPVQLTGQVTLSLAAGSTALAAPPAINSITLNGSFSTESGGSPANGWSVHSFDNAVFDLYRAGSFVALDDSTDPRDFPLLTGTAVDGLLSDHGPAAQYPGGICPFPGGCLSANVFQLFRNGTTIFNTTTNTPNFPGFADAGNHPLVGGMVTQTNPSSGLGFENGMDAFVVEAVLDNLNNLQPYGDGVDGKPGIVRIVTFSNTGNTAYMIEGSIVEVPVPLPAAAWLFGSALALTAFWRRRATRRTGRRRCTLIRSAAVLLMPVLIAGCVDGGASPPDTDPDNRRPTADAGPDQVVLNQTLVRLDGSGSSDPDGDPLIYAWEFVSRPAGSLAVLSGADTVMPEFTPDVTGDYVIRLTVDDEFANGRDSDRVVISAEDPGTNPPVANAGPDQDLQYSPPSLTINLDGSGSSDPDNDPLSFAWEIVEFTPASGLPPAQQVVLFGADTATPFFEITDPDQLGVYRLRLTVDDGTLQDSDEIQVTVTKGMPTAGLLLGSGLFGFAAFTAFRRRLGGQ